MAEMLNAVENYLINPKKNWIHMGALYLILMPKYMFFDTMET